MSNFTIVIGLIAVVVIISLGVAAYQPILGSVAEDARANNISNSTHNQSYIAGTGVARGFLGFDTVYIYIVFILLIIVVLLLIFVF
jgi:hypothetical protein